MVNPARILALAGGRFAKRDTSAWTSAISTSFQDASQATTVTALGYYSTIQSVSGSKTFVSTDYSTTAITFSVATLPLLTTSSPDAYCSTQYSAYENDPFNLEYSPTFQVGYTVPCLPTGWYTVSYYSPGICPSGYTIADRRTFATTVSNSEVLETGATCCFSSFQLTTDNFNGGYICQTYFNPPPITTGSLSATTIAPVSHWTVTAQYTSVSESTSVFNTVLGSGSTTLTIPTTSYSEVATSSQLFTIVSGGDVAPIVAPTVEVRWQSSDQAVISWLQGQSPPPKNTSSPLPSRPPQSKSNTGISGGEIAGIVVGAVALLGLFIGGLYFCMRRRKQRTQSLPSTTEDMAEHHYIQPKGHSDSAPMSPATGQTELDSRSLSPEQYMAYNRAFSPQGVQPRPFMSPPMPELGVRSPSESIAGNTLNEGSHSPPEWNEPETFSTARETERFLTAPETQAISTVPQTDMHGFLISSPDPGPSTSPPPRSSWLEQQQKQIREEKARLTRLQELSEMEAKLEEQLQRELAEERR